MSGLVIVLASNAGGKETESETLNKVWDSTLGIDVWGYMWGYCPDFLFL